VDALILYRQVQVVFLYRHFDHGNDGKPEPFAGASGNGMSDCLARQ
jgi:hypothetical protein